MFDKPRVVRVSTSSSGKQGLIPSDMDLQDEVDEAPDQPVRPIQRPTIPLLARNELLSIDLEQYQDTGLQVTIGKEAVEEVTLADIGRLMQDAASSDVDLDVEWAVPEATGDEPTAG